MSMVRFATICDVPDCNTKSAEYSRLAICRECGDDVCTAHILPGSYQDDDGEALCLGCDEEEKRVSRQAP